MTSVSIALRHDVEEERFHVEVKRFVVQKEFGQEAEILTVHFVLFSVDFEDGNVILPVNLIARRMAPHALGQVSA